AAGALRSAGAEGGFLSLRRIGPGPADDARRLFIALPCPARPASRTPAWARLTDLPWAPPFDLPRLPLPFDMGLMTPLLLEFRWLWPLDWGKPAEALLAGLLGGGAAAPA
ncbi:MAG: hypothetical protein HUK26_09915, partial [Duodenibacillus sp.]|nr:hypothetical protein [Duodenibacillus sp.]